MKKYFIGIILMLFAFNVNALTVPEKDSGNKVTIYLFRGDGCGYCSKAIEYFNGLAGKYDDYFELKAYEVWYDKSNSNLLDEVKKELSISETGVPLFVIGDDYHTVGFSEAMSDSILEAAFLAYKDENYTDVVKAVREDLSDSYTEENLKEVAIAEGLTYLTSDNHSKNSNKDAYIIIGIFGILALGIGTLIYYSNKNKA